MRFLIQADNGNRILGWVVPDNPTAISRVHVTIDGQRVAEVPATRTEEVLRERGWHSTGQCQFVINDKIVPGLAEKTSLEIHDVDTNLLIYRRAPPDEKRFPGKAVLVNTSIHPETVIQTTLFPYFRQCYFGIGKLSEEVLGLLFDTVNLTSSLMSGAFAFPRYEAHFVQSEAVTMMLIHDPYVEMARRLLWLRERAAIAEDPQQSWRLGPLVEAASFTTEYDYANARSLKRLFRMLPEPAYHLLYNPLTRQLGTRVPEDRVHPSISIVAVEVLARIGIVGHRDYFAAFMTTVLDRLGLDIPVPAPAPIPAETLALAEQLRALPVAQDMVNFDAVISQGVRRSVANGWGA